ncbi:hypothetical protein [uncultured Jatrophihabitans sp.]|uniref:hypothetical protein n=1 Tax=uncultured Jatrophihabitans sp. TaxID=1610747 RepID=UPI0035CAD039
MSTLFAGVRRGDVALATLLTALGVLLMVENINSTDHSTRVDSHSWLLVPVFAAATVPILWRRRNLFAVYAATAAALAVHTVAFDWVVRCGAGLPLAFALSYAAGRLERGRHAVIGLIVTVGLQALVLVRDSAAGLGILPVTAGISVVFWGIGIWLQRRSQPVVIVDTGAPVAVGTRG